MSDKIKCPKCGQENRSERSYCHSCYTALSEKPSKQTTQGSKISTASYAYKIISSPTYTFYYSYLMPVICFVVSIVALIGYLNGMSIGNMSTNTFMIVVIFGIPFSVYTFGHWKEVRMDGNYLYISDYFKKDRIPLANVKTIIAYSQGELRLTFHQKTKFGKVVRFERGMTLNRYVIDSESMLEFVLKNQIETNSPNRARIIIAEKGFQVIALVLIMILVGGFIIYIGAFR